MKDKRFLKKLNTKLAIMWLEVNTEGAMVDKKKQKNCGCAGMIAPQQYNRKKKKG